MGFVGGINSPESSIGAKWGLSVSHRSFARSVASK